MNSDVSNLHTEIQKDILEKLLANPSYIDKNGNVFINRLQIPL